MKGLHLRLNAILLAALVGGCTDPLESGESGSHQQLTWQGSRLLLWGVVGLSPAGPERKAHGASAVAVDPAGAVYLLDQLNQRLLQITADTTIIAAQVPEDAEDLTAGPEGSFAVYSPLRARIWTHDKAGHLDGQLSIPRVFRHVRGIGLAPSRNLTFHNAFQETYQLGTPSLPRPLEEVMHSKREGAYFLGDGTGVAVRLKDKQPEILLLGKTSYPYPLPETVLAARIIGVAQETVCLRLELLISEPPIEVQRRAICLDASSGQCILSKDLPSPGLYLPRRELAVGGDPPRLAFIHPEKRGLRLHVWPLKGGTQ